MLHDHHTAQQAQHHGEIRPPTSSCMFAATVKMSRKANFACVNRRAQSPRMPQRRLQPIDVVPNNRCRDRCATGKMRRRGENASPKSRRRGTAGCADVECASDAASQRRGFKPRIYSFIIITSPLGGYAPLVSIRFLVSSHAPEHAQYRQPPCDNNNMQHTTGTYAEHVSDEE